jgi:antitoxin component of MazEF toxin-antitoxin module
MVTLGMWGNALALRLPSHIVKTAKLRPGMAAELRLKDDGSIVVRLAGAKARCMAGVASEASSEAGDAIVPKPAVW